MVKQAARNATKKGAVQKKKTVTKAKQKKEQDHHHASSSSSSSPSIRSKFVGVSWYKERKKWKAGITIDGKLKSLGYFDDEKEAACKYDEQAALLNKPVNFPQHEGQEQAVKRAPKGSGPKAKSHAKSSKDSDDEQDEDEDEEEAMDEDSDDDDDYEMIILDSSSSSSLRAFQQRRVEFATVKQEEEGNDTSAAQAFEIDSDGVEIIGTSCPNARRSSRTLVPRKIKGEEDRRNGRISCPYPKCEHDIYIKLGKCNLTTCTARWAHKDFFHFCYHCKRQIFDDTYCKRQGCPRGNGIEAREVAQENRNNESKKNPIRIESSSD